MPGVAMRQAEVNGRPGVVIEDGEGRVVSVMSLEIAGGQVTAVSSIVNPDKLAHVGEVADVRALLKPS
jgi:RNA polymerase sigma-70 factor (ECF subfamily)